MMDTWAELREQHQPMINLGGKRDHHPRRSYENWWSIGKGAVRHAMDEASGRPYCLWFRFPGKMPLNDGSASRVLSEHMLEHLPPDAVGEVLAEAHRVLAPGGTIRICVPDKNCPGYMKHENAKAKNRHRSFWTGPAMTDALKDAGFRGIDLQCWFSDVGYHHMPVNWGSRSELGHVRRTLENLLSVKKWIRFYTCLIVDAVK